MGTIAGDKSQGAVVVSGDGTTVSVKVPDGSGGLTDVADFAASGITLQSTLTMPTGQQGSSYSSDLLDLTVAADNISIHIPKRPGFMFFRTSGALVVHDMTGTATGPLQGGIGNDAGRTNLVVVNTSAASLNAIAGALPLALATSSPSSGNLDSVTQYVGKITTPPTGVTAMHGYLQVWGFWVPS